MVQSGQIGEFDQVGEETALYERLTEELLKERIRTLRFDVPQRPASNLPANDRHCAERKARLFEVLRYATSQGLLDNAMMFGMSLGGQAILEVLDRYPVGYPPMRAAVLAGTVVERSYVFNDQIGEVTFVYGERDHIAYVSSTAPNVFFPIPPSLYGPWSAQRVCLCNNGAVRVEILAGLGHTLQPPADRPSVDTDGAIDNIIRLIVSSLTREG